MTRKTKTYLLILGAAFLLLVGLPLWFIFGPPRRLIISKETTVLTQPLNAEGQVDYVEAVLQMQRAGVTPQNNAAVPLVQATWEGERLQPEQQDFLCKELGISKPDQDGIEDDLRSQHYKDLIVAWASEKWGVDLGDESLYDFDASFYLDDVRYQPWRRADYPPLATWVEENGERFDLLHTMEQRDRFYYPSPFLAKPNGTLISNTQVGSQRLRHAARALQCRAMMFVGEGDAQRAWDDLRLIYLMSRMQMPHCSIVDVMIGHAIEGVAFDGTKYLLNSGHCDRQLLDEMAQFLGDLPPPVDVEKVIDTTDRWAMLEVGMRAVDAQNVTIGQPLPGYADLLALPYDRNMTLRRINQRYDEWTALMKIDDPAKYLKATQQFSTQSETDLQTWNDRSAIAAAILSQSVRGIYAGDAICRWTFDSLVSAKRPYFRTLTEEQLTRIAIQLSKYRLEHDEYPTSLSDMDPQLEAADLQDLYAPGKDLIYERRDDGGFLLYSRFENASDDQGTSWFGEIFRGDWTAPGEELEIDGEFVFVSDVEIDLVLRFPLPGPPPLAKPKSKAEEEAEMRAAFGEDFE